MRRLSNSLVTTQESIRSLTSMVERILQTSEAVSRRVASLETEFGTLNGLLTPGDPGLVRGEDASILSQCSTEERIPYPFRDPPISQFDSMLKSEIYASRVYLRTQKRHSISSLTSTSGSIGGLSILSGISLAQVSNISVLSLPIYSFELSKLWHPQYYGASYVVQAEYDHTTKKNTTENTIRVDTTIASTTSSALDGPDLSDTNGRAQRPRLSSKRTSRSEDIVLNTFLQLRARSSSTPEEMAKNARIEGIIRKDRLLNENRTKVLLLGK